MLLNRITKNTKIQSIIIIVLYLLLLYVFYVLVGGGWVFFIFFIFISVLQLHVEVKSLLSKLIIIQSNKFDYFSLILALLWGLNVSLFPQKDIEIFGIKANILIITSAIFIPFIMRGRHIILSKNYIKYGGNDFFNNNRIKIIWNKILNVVIDNDLLIIESDTKRIEIQKKYFFNEDFSVIIRMIHSKVDNNKIKMNNQINH